MATTIVTKNSSTASAVPTAGQLVQGELAVNVADKRLYTEDNAGAIVELGTNPSTLTVTGEITANGGIALGDSDKATFGAGDDLQIYHDGSNSYIVDAGAGDLYFRSAANLYIGNAAGTQSYITAADGGAVDLRYNGSSKLATTATGIDVTGTATMDGLTVDGAATVTGDTIIIDSATQAFYTADRGDSGYYAINRYFTAGTENWRVGLLNDGTSNFHIYDVAGSGDRLSIGTNGDISFYEDTGTTAKLFWDASAEDLQIGGNLLNLSGVSSGTTGARLNANGGGMLRLASGGVDALYVVDGGNVGIGSSTDLTGSRVHIAQSVAGANKGITLSADGTSTNGYADFSISPTDTLTIQMADDIAYKNIALNPLGGNVGIGTTTPAAKLHATGTFGATLTSGIRLDGLGTTTNNLAPIAFYTQSSSWGTQHAANIAAAQADGADGGAYLRFSTSPDGNTAPAERLRIDASGNVGIGISSPTQKLDVSDVSRYTFNVGNSYTLQTSLNAGGSAVADSYINAAQHIFQTSATERMRIDSSGNLLVGTTDENVFDNTSGNGSVLRSSGDVQIAVDSGETMYLNRMGSDGRIVNFRKAGVFVAGIDVTSTTVTYNTSSDQRLKENITDANDAGSKIDAIQVRQYDWKADGSHQDYGMVAQELQLVAPEAVSGDADSEEMMGVDYSKLVPMLIKEIQSLRNRVAQLEGI
jgi:hypothetical protein